MCRIVDWLYMSVPTITPAGVKHPNVVCDNCGQSGITGTRWKCARCNDYDLCTECYMSGKHSLEHEFDRIDIMG